MPVATVVAMVAEGLTVEEIVADFPYLEPEDITEALRYAAAVLLDGGLSHPGEGFGQFVDAADQGHEDLATAGPVDDLEDPSDDRRFGVAGDDQVPHDHDLGVGGFVEERPEAVVTVPALYVAGDVQLGHLLTSGRPACSLPR